MSEAIPLGAKENERLEFKGRTAVEKPEILGRAVVAMLNARGGTVWIGLRDEGDRAVAIEPIEDPDQVQRRLLDYLVDAIEPAPSELEIRLCQVPTDSGIILRVDAKPQASHRPYALLRSGGRVFVTRVADRIRPMTREEILTGSTKPAPSNQTQQALGKVLADRAEAQRERGESFWLRLEPTEEMELDIQAQLLEDLLQEPRLSGNREAGWNFARRLHRPTVGKNKLITNPSDLGQVELRRDGGLVFRLPLRRLHWKGEDPREIWPFVLLEYPISAFRIAQKIYEDKLQGPVVADLALFGISGWKLRPGSPDSWFFAEPATFSESTDLTWERPLVFSVEEIDTQPDRCGLRLVERVYEAFGLRREAVPREFDRESGRLVLPE